MQRHTDVYDSKGQLLLSTIGIEIETWDALYPTWSIAIVFERKVATNTTGRLEWHNIVAIVERGKAVRWFQ